MSTRSNMSVRHTLPSPSILERALIALGTEPDVAESLLGDVMEEFAARRSTNGGAIARLWLVREMLRSAPHFVWNAVRHGSPTVRARVAALVGGLALLITIVMTALLLRDGAPSHLIADPGFGAAGIIVNNVQPVQLKLLALDDAGRKVSSNGMRFRWQAGVRALVSPRGVLTCTHDGDVTIRASLGDATADVDVLCRRVRDLRASSWIDMVAGDPARPLPYLALGVDGSFVTELRGEASVLDSAVATLVGANIRPRAVGRTTVDVRIGDRWASILATVHEPVRSLDALRADQHFVALPVHLARGDTVRWALPREAFWLAYLPRRPGDAPPTIILDGLVTCAPGDAMHVYLAPVDEPRMYCIVHSANAGVTLAHGAAGASSVDGSLLFERADEWRRPQ